MFKKNEKLSFKSIVTRDMDFSAWLWWLGWASVASLEIGLLLYVLPFLNQKHHEDSLWIKNGCSGTPPLIHPRSCLRLEDDNNQLYFAITYLAPILLVIGAFIALTPVKIFLSSLKKYFSTPKIHPHIQITLDFLEKYPEYPAEIPRQSIFCPIKQAETQKPIYLEYKKDGVNCWEAYSYKQLKIWCRDRTVSPNHVDFLDKGITHFKISFDIPKQRLLPNTSSLELKK